MGLLIPLNSLIHSGANHGPQMTSGNAQHEALANIFNASDFTVVFNQKFDPANNDHGLMLHLGDSFAVGTIDYADPYVIKVGKSATLGSTVTTLLSSIGTVLGGVWHRYHITFNHTSGTLKLYIDGVLDNTSAGGLAFTAAVSPMNSRLMDPFANVVFGYGPGGSAVAQNLSDVQVWSREFSAGDVAAGFNAGEIVPASSDATDLVAAWSCGAGTGPYVINDADGADNLFSTTTGDLDIYGGGGNTWSVSHPDYYTGGGGGGGGFGAIKQTSCTLACDSGCPTRFDFLVKDLDDNPVDLSSGVLAQLNFISLSDARMSYIRTVGGTWTYGADGVLSLDVAAVDTLRLPCNENMTCECLLTGDAWLTANVVAKGTLRNSQIMR